ncbi:MAG: hypothetical protein KY454_08265 [Actinobacteria bacterium]|nr:hypothetical protein [Actinomycetota bacterium]MBW3650235.1 hypothetical protein [Actinomycetota bacterium]
MSDLSNLLGDVYGHNSASDAPPAPKAPAGGRAPEWASDSQLDRAFADWEPEARYPLAPAPAPAPVAQPSPSADDHLVAALSAALTESLPHPTAPAPAPAVAPQPAPVVAPVPRPAQAMTPTPPASPGPAAVPAPAPMVVAAPGVAAKAWAPGDDDIFPNAKGAKNKKR